MDANKIEDMRDRIRGFELECQAEEYTDTGDAWEVLQACEKLLNELVKEITHMTKKAEHGCTDAYCPMCDGDLNEDDLSSGDKLIVEMEGPEGLL